MELPNGWYTAIIVIFVSISFLKFKRKQRESLRQEDAAADDDPFAIEPCPNPNCIRCRKYAEVNAAALASIKTLKDPPARIVEAIKVGRHGFGGSERNNTGISPRTGQYPTVLLIPGLTARPIVTDLYLKTCIAIQQHTSTILQEYLEANDYAEWLQNDVSGASNEQSTWNVSHLMNQGYWNQENSALCPETTKVVKSLDIMDGCVFGNAFLSVLTPGTSIEPHCGPTNARHRLHLALQVPKETSISGGEPVLKVLNECVTWKEGKAFVFDDSLTHAVDYPESRMSSTTPRVVLIVDLWHPDLTASERSTIRKLYPTT